MTWRTLLALVPFALTGLIYRAMGLVPRWGLESWRVHVCDLRALDLAWFGSAGSNTSPSDWLQAHATRGLDVLCAVPYATYLVAAVVYTLWLAQGDPARRAIAHRFGWAFLVLNVAGFVTYHLYPAAPPWYYHAHGCVVDVAAAPSPGPNLSRVDALLGVSLFAHLYHQSSWVFGAMPSLHVAYPLLMLLTGWTIHGALARVALGTYWLWMCFAAVYLDHHWIADVVVGSIYALAVFGAVRALARARWRMAPERSVP